MKKICIVIIAKNASKQIGACIDSVRSIQENEIIVIDDVSTDETVSFVRSLNIRVVIHEKKDFAEIRNFAISKTDCEWILYIDSDEKLSSELTKEINDFLTDDHQEIGAISMTRENYFLGKKWTKNEIVIRLFRRELFKKWYGQIHESPSFGGKLHSFHNQIIHNAHMSLESMVLKTESWSGIEAHLRNDAHHPKIVWWRFPRVMIPVFIDYYIHQGGWRVGSIGLIESMYQAFSIFITYARLWEIQNKSTRLPI